MTGPAPKAVPDVASICHMVLLHFVYTARLRRATYVVAGDGLMTLVPEGTHGRIPMEPVG
jgi:hypothetical protein